MMLVHAAPVLARDDLWRHWLDEPGAAAAIVAIAAVYAAGVRAVWRRAGTGHGVRRTQVWCFAAGCMTVLVATVTPLAAASDDLFAAHMVQHVLLATVAPPLLVAGAPLAGMVWAFPVGSRSRLTGAVRSAAWLQSAWRAMTSPSVSWVLHAAALWAWHMPRLYQLALRRDLWHAVEHASFLGTGVLLWWGILHPGCARRTGYAIGICTVFATLMQSGALGALLTLSSHVWYPAHAAGAAAWGMSELEDQQLAGLIMWVVGGLLYVVAMSVLFLGWLGAGDRRRTSRAASGLTMETA